jgi:isopropylmalate/homocitrate/citramalate synthase
LAERAGGVALDEFVVVVQELFGQPLGIKTEELYLLSKFVEKITNFPIPRTKPLVGDQAFAHKSDTHIQAVSKYMPGFQGINPELVGRKIEVVLGNVSGPFAIKAKALELGLKLEEDHIAEIVKLVREKAEENRRALTNQEFVDIASRFTEGEGN